MPIPGRRASASTARSAGNTIAQTSSTQVAWASTTKTAEPEYAPRTAEYVTIPKDVNLRPALSLRGVVFRRRAEADFEGNAGDPAGGRSPGPAIDRHASPVAATGPGQHSDFSAAGVWTGVTMPAGTYVVNKVPGDAAGRPSTTGSTRATIMSFIRRCTRTSTGAELFAVWLGTPLRAFTRTQGFRLQWFSGQ